MRKSSTKGTGSALHNHNLDFDMKITVSVYDERLGQTYSGSAEVGWSLAREVFSPIKSTDDGQEVPYAVAEQKLELRKDLAEKVVRIATEQLLQILKKDDRFNGYPIGSDDA